MLGRSHRICSVAIVELGLLSTNLILKNPVANVLLLVATAIGASLPDLDEYNSSASRKSIINFSLFLRHRGITHSLLGWGFFSYALYWGMNHLYPFKIVPNIIHNYWGCIWLGLVIGYLLHLVEDSFSNQGVNWLAPLVKRTGKPLLHYKVGGWFEKLLASVAYFGIILMSLYWIYLATMLKV